MELFGIDCGRAEHLTGIPVSGCHAQAWALAPRWPAEMFCLVCFCLSALRMALLACRLLRALFFGSVCASVASEVRAMHASGMAVRGILGQPACCVVACMYGLAV